VPGLNRGEGALLREDGTRFCAEFREQCRAMRIGNQFGIH